MEHDLRGARGMLAAQDDLSRYGTIVQDALELLELMERWEPTEGAVEEPFVSQNARTAIAIGQAQADALVAAASRGIDAARYAPGEVKRAVTGYGGSSKEQIQRSVCIQLDIEDSDIAEDAADALAVALCHIRARTEKQILAQG